MIGLCPKSATLKTDLDFVEHWNLMIFLSQTDELTVGVYLDWFIAQVRARSASDFFLPIYSSQY